MAFVQNGLDGLLGRVVYVRQDAVVDRVSLECFSTILLNGALAGKLRRIYIFRKENVRVHLQMAKLMEDGGQKAGLHLVFE